MLLFYNQLKIILGSKSENFHNFHQFVLEATTEMFCKIGVLQLEQRTSKNLYTSSFLAKMKDELIMNAFIGISFFAFVDGCLSLTINTPWQCNYIFEAWFSPVKTTNSLSVRINSKGSGVAGSRQLFSQKGSIAYVWLVLATPLKWELIFRFLFYKFAVEFFKLFDEWNLNSYCKNFQKYQISKLNSHNMADTFWEELMIAMFLLRNTFAWDPLKEKKNKQTNKKSKRIIF